MQTDLSTPFVYSEIYLDNGGATTGLFNLAITANYIPVTSLGVVYTAEGPVSAARSILIEQCGHEGIELPNGNEVTIVLPRGFSNLTFNMTEILDLDFVLTNNSQNPTKCTK